MSRLDKSIDAIVASASARARAWSIGNGPDALLIDGKGGMNGRGPPVGRTLRTANGSIDTSPRARDILWHTLRLANSSHLPEKHTQAAIARHML